MVRAEEVSPPAPEALRVIYLEPSVPSISYRGWAHNLRSFTPLAWLCGRLTHRYGNESLLIACHDEADREMAQPIADQHGLLVAVCRGSTLLQALGDLAALAAARPLIYFHVEAMFSPAVLIDRALEHHIRCGNHFTYISDIPALLAPEIIESDLARALSSLSFHGGIPSPREIVARLNRPGLRAEPFHARPDFGVAPCDEITPFAAPEDVDRARQAVADLAAEHTWEIVERWKGATYVAEPLALSARASGGTQPRILYVSAGSFYSGAEECLRGLVERLAKSGFEQAAVVGVEGIFAQRLRDAGCEVAAANCNLLTSNRALAAHVFDRVQPSIVHANGTIGDAFLEIASERSVPVILHVRTAVFRDTTRLHAADHLIAPSAFSREQLIRAGISPTKISLVYEGVDVDRFSPGCLEKDTCRMQFDLPPGAFVVLMIARPTASKRHDLIIDAFAQLRRSRADACLVFVGNFGDAPFFHQMQLKTHQLDVAEHVRWLPFQRDIRAIECAADVVALPSDLEALGMCSLEAMALEIPAIVSDAGGGRELVEDGVSGLVIRGGEAASLASALERLAGDPDFRREVARNGRRRACEYFSLRRHAEQVAGIFQGWRHLKC